MSQANSIFKCFRDIFVSNILVDADRLFKLSYLQLDCICTKRCGKEAARRSDIIKRRGVSPKANEAEKSRALTALGIVSTRTNQP